MILERARRKSQTLEVEAGEVIEMNSGSEGATDEVVPLNRASAG